WSLLPLRVLRRLRAAPHRLIFEGQPAIGQSTAAYARRLMRQKRPTGPRVALLTGCLMEALFREINFATVRVLVENNVQVVVPAGQGCCGAFQEHLGLSGVESLRTNNRRAFNLPDLDAVLTNSSGCGLALSKALRGTGPAAGDPRPMSEGSPAASPRVGGQDPPSRAPVLDVLEYLGGLPLVARQRPASAARVYVDLPCHLIHGQKVQGIPASVLDATGFRWQLAPGASDCCGSGGVYNLRKPDNAREILQRKSSFLNQAEGDPVILASSNHVCLMQWHSARSLGLVERPFQVRHVIQLLDPEPALPGML
ncbi:MAG: (Fe-S)-binding protein, partial [Pirellulaceae bacterium]|nr:(Fe-S)-binding protein [Pirellulaceae bacterium]